MALGVLLFLVQNVVFNFSKSGFVFAIFDLGIIAHFYQGALRRKLLSFRLVGTVALLGLLPAVLVLTVVSAASGASPLQMVITRLAATGSGTYMYFLLDGSDALIRMGLTERLGLYFDTLLSALRFKAWAPLSYSGIVSTYITGVELPGFGTNPYPFVAGHFLFGWGGIFYCFGVGALLSFVRTRRTNLLVFYVANQAGIVFVTDPGITQAQIVALIVISPVFAIVWLIALCQRKEVMVSVTAAYARWASSRRARPPERPAHAWKAPS
jgi:hypothetical protein